MWVQKKRFLPEKVLKIVDCRECGGLLAKPTCTATVYFHNFTIPEYIEIDKSELSVPPPLPVPPFSLPLQDLRML